MLKWVVTGSPTKQVKSGASSSANQSLAEESVLDNTDSLIEWQDSVISTTDSSNNDSSSLTACDISCCDHSPAGSRSSKDGSEFSSPGVCHGLNADSGIYSTSTNGSHLDESFGLEDSGIHGHSTSLSHSDTTSNTSSTICDTHTANLPTTHSSSHTANLPSSIAASAGFTHRHSPCKTSTQTDRLFPSSALPHKTDTILCDSSRLKSSSALDFGGNRKKDVVNRSLDLDSGSKLQSVSAVDFNTVGGVYSRRHIRNRKKIVNRSLDFDSDSQVSDSTVTVNDSNHCKSRSLDTSGENRLQTSSVVDFSDTNRHKATGFNRSLDIDSNTGLQTQSAVNFTDIGKNQYSIGRNNQNTNKKRIVTRSLDFDNCSELSTDDELSIGYYSETESLDLEDVFAVAKKQNYNQKGPRKGRRNYSLRKKGRLQRKLSDDGSAQETVHLKRSRLVEQIDRENKLKLGAENLFKATDNRRLKQTVEVELKFIQSHIQLLTDELSDLDTNMENKDILTSGVHRGFPMIQIGLKETKDIDFHYAFKNFIEEHYYENGDCFNKEIEEFETLRQMVRCPLPTDEGISLLYEYYNHLYFIDKRFFGSGKGLGVYFPWYDAVTGTLSTQKTMGFEKGCVLFNIAALYSQIAAQKRRVCSEDCEQTTEYLQRAAGVLRHLDDNFSYAPSTDMQPHTLKILIHLMLTQAQECSLETVIHRHNAASSWTIHNHMQMAQEAAMVYDQYKYCRQLMHFESIKDYVPHKWHILVQVKTLYFKATANYHAAHSLMGLNSYVEDTHASAPAAKHSVYEEVCDMFDKMPQSGRATTGDEPDHSVKRFITGTPDERKHLAQACLSRAILAHEEALRVHSQHQRVNRIPYYHDVHQILKISHDRCFRKYSDLEEEDDFTELSTVPNIKGKSSHMIDHITPDITLYKVRDPFQRLGPLAIFSARHHWSEPKRIELHKKPGQEFGFSVRGEQPTIVAQVDDDSIAQKCGIVTGDFIIRISNQEVKWSKHQDIVQLIRNAGQTLVIGLISPLDKNYLSGETISNHSGTGKSNVKQIYEDMSVECKSKHVMQCGTLDRNKHIRLSGRSTKSLNFTLRRLKPLGNKKTEPLKLGNKSGWENMIKH